MDIEPNVITVAHEEIEGSPVESVGPGGLQAVRMLQCSFADRLLLAAELRGGDRMVDGVHVHTLAHGYPHDPSACAADVRIEPFGQTVAGGSGQVIAYALARLTVTYRVPPHQSAGPVPLASESLEPAAEFVTLPHEGLYWDDQASEPLSESEAPARLVRMLEWVYVRHRQIDLPPAVLGLVGMVNDSALTSQSLQLTFPAGTLLYNPPRLEREITTSGAGAWRVTYRFTYRPEGWNAFPRRGRQQMQTIYAAGQGGCQPFMPYQAGDFLSLLA